MYLMGTTFRYRFAALVMICFSKCQCIWDRLEITFSVFGYQLRSMTQRNELLQDLATQAEPNS